MDSAICIQFTPTFLQYKQFVEYTAKRRTRWLRPFGVIALVCFLFVPLLPFEGNPTLLAKYTTCEGFLILPGVLFVFLPLSVYFSAKKRWNTAAELRALRNYEFSDAGLSVSGETFQGFTKWVNIVRAEASGQLIFLYTGQALAYLIPVDCFEDLEQVETFKTLVRKHVTDCTRLGLRPVSER